MQSCRRNNWVALFLYSVFMHGRICVWYIFIKSFVYTVHARRAPSLNLHKISSKTTLYNQLSICLHNDMYCLVR